MKKTDDILKEIDESFAQRTQFPNATFNIHSQQLDWLIRRVKCLTIACKDIEMAERILHKDTGLEICSEVARRALEGDK